MPTSRCVGPTQSGAEVAPILPYNQSASSTCTIARTSTIVASHTFILMVPEKPSVKSERPTGS